MRDRLGVLLLGERVDRPELLTAALEPLDAPLQVGALGIGLLSGGYGEAELDRAGAMRVFDDPADMLEHLDELAPRTRD